MKPLNDQTSSQEPEKISEGVRLPGGELEYAVLFSVCDLTAASVRDVHRRIGRVRGLAYTTIAKVLERLHVKALVTRERKGTTLVYCPRVDRKMIELERARVSLRSLLASNVKPAMATLVEAMDSLDSSFIQELERAVAAQRGKKKDGP